MKAIILAAGRGSRMRQLTDDRPKCLVELGGKALLDLQIDALRKAGIREISVVTGYMRESILSRGLFEFNNSNWAATNMVSSLACAQQWLQAEPCIVSYSDIFYDASAIESLMSSSSNIAVTYDPNWLEIWERRFEDPLIDAETFRLNSDNTLLEIGNKPKSLQEVEGQYMGLLRFTPKGWDEVLRILAILSPEERNRIHMTGTLQKIIDAGRLSIEAIPYGHSWGEVDSAEDLMAYQKSIL
jgi:choline kinase